MRVLVENTAGGKNSVARYMDSIERLWEVIGDLNVGLCLDTCHTWAWRNSNRRSSERI